MSLENVQEDLAAERSPALSVSGTAPFGEVNKQNNAQLTLSSSREKVVAFKFGGTSLLGSKRMLHAASLVRAAAQVSSITVVVSAMKDVTDRLLSLAHSLAEGRLSYARNTTESILFLHLDVLRELQLEEDDDLRVRRRDVRDVLPLGA